MENKLKVLLSMMNALPEQRIDGREYEPVQGQLTAFKSGNCVEHHDFTCSMDDYQELVTNFYNDCKARGLTPSFGWSRVSII
jgi:hypothetical protein